MRDILPSFVLSIIMGAMVYFEGVYLFEQTTLNLIAQLSVTIVSGAMIYLGLAKLLRLECFDYLVNTVKEYRLGKLGRNEDAPLGKGN